MQTILVQISKFPKNICHKNVILTFHYKSSVGNFELQLTAKHLFFSEQKLFYKKTHKVKSVEISKIES